MEILIIILLAIIIFILVKREDSSPTQSATDNQYNWEARGAAKRVKQRTRHDKNYAWFG